MPKATPKSWPNLRSAPAAKADLEIEAVIEPEAYALIQQGFIPRTRNDKWFIYLSEDGWLRCHRAATGVLVYWAKFDSTQNEGEDAYTITEAWANRKTEEYRMKDAAYDARVFVYLLRKLLLKHDVPFPTPAAMPHQNKPLHEKHVMGHDDTIGGSKPSFIPLNDLLE